MSLKVSVFLKHQDDLQSDTITNKGEMVHERNKKRDERLVLQWWGVCPEMPRLSRQNELIISAQ